MYVNIWVRPCRIEFYSPKLQADLLAWPAGIAASFAAISQRMVEHGPNLGLPYTRAKGGGLFEVRARGAEGIGRAIFVLWWASALWCCTASSRRRGKRRWLICVLPKND